MHINSNTPYQASILRKHRPFGGNYAHVNTYSRNHFGLPQAFAHCEGRNKDVYYPYIFPFGRRLSQRMVA